MTALDKAFIKAYAHDQAHEAPPAPHIGSAPAMRMSGPLAQHDAVAENAPPQVATSAAGADRPLVPPPHVDVSRVAAAQSTAREERDSDTAPTTLRMPTVAFHPGYEVEHVVWPEVCETLAQRLADALAQLIKKSSVHASRDAGLLAFMGGTPGAGCTTSLVTFARFLSQQQRSRSAHVLLVDGNEANGSVASQLGLAPQTGWLDVMARQAELADAVIESLGDGVAVLPFAGLQASPQTSIDTEAAAAHLATLRQHFDTVLVDLGPFEHVSRRSEILRAALTTQNDQLLLVRDARTSTPVHIEHCVVELERLGAKVNGLIDNFDIDATPATQAA